MRVQGGEEDDEENQAIFSAVVGERELGEAVAGEGCCGNVEGGAGLALDGGEEGVFGVGFIKEGVDFVVALGNYV